MFENIYGDHKYRAHYIIIFRYYCFNLHRYSKTFPPAPMRFALGPTGPGGTQS